MGVSGIHGATGRLLDPFQSQGVGGVEVVSFRTGERAISDAFGNWSLSLLATGVDSRESTSGARRRGLQLDLGQGLYPKFRSIDVSGKRIASRSGIPSDELSFEFVGSPRASLRLLDTLFFYQAGRLVLKDTLSDPFRSGIDWDLDTGWNAAILYGQIQDVRDGRRYRTVTVGSQTWLAQNLAFDAPGSGGDFTDPDSTSLFGRTYRWHVLLGLADSCATKTCFSQVGASHRGVCPAGFHVPSYQEWEELLSTAGGEDKAGTNLKSRDSWGVCPTGNRFLSSADRFGFRAWPRYYGSTGGNANFLAADEYSDAYATDVIFSLCMEGWMGMLPIPGQSNKGTSYSARCIADVP